MDKIKELVGLGGDKTTEDIAEFVKKVEALASDKVSGDKYIEALAGMVGKVKLRPGVNVDNGVYWVGLLGVDAVSITPNEALVNDPKCEIPRSLAVLMTPSDNLLITTVPETNEEKLDSFKFRLGTYKVLDLTTTVSPPRCWFSLTSQLSGCTFATGCLETRLYMGHAQSKPNVAFAEDGLQVASSLKEKRKTMFQNVEGNLESTFLVSRGREFNIDKSESDSQCIITYPGYADVIGLVCNKNIYFIVTIKDTIKVDKVVLVTQKTGSKTWQTKEMKQTWSPILKEKLKEEEVSRKAAMTARLGDVMREPPPSVIASTPVSKAITMLLQPNTKLLMVISDRIGYSLNKGEFQGKRVLGFLTREATFISSQALPFSLSSDDTTEED